MSLTIGRQLTDGTGVHQLLPLFMNTEAICMEFRPQCKINQLSGNSQAMAFGNSERRKPSLQVLLKGSNALLHGSRIQMSM